MEIERKFIVPRDVINQFEIMSVDIIEQYYVSVSPEIRYRRKGDKYSKSDKSDGGMVREQEEGSTLKMLFEKNKKKMIGSLIHKIRLDLRYAEGMILEVDLYLRPYTDLVIAELEFSTDMEAHAFQPPKNWTEITYLKEYKNLELAQHGFPKNAEKTTYIPKKV